MDDVEHRFVNRCILGFRAHFRTLPASVASAPGRVNLIGEHVDYCGGLVLPFAIPNRTTIALGPSPDGLCRLFSSRIGSEVTFAPEELERAGDWGDHVRGVLAEYRELGVRVPPLAAWVDSDVSMGGGLSSSAALSVAAATAFEVMSGQRLEPAERARLCQRAEQRAVGVACGLMDQMAVACAREGHALFFDTRSGVTEPIPLALGDRRVVLADSRVPRALDGTEYNTRRAECERALEKLRAAGWELEDLRGVEEDRLEEAAAVLDDTELRRVRHQATENARVLAAVEALRAGDVDRLAPLLDASHVSLRDDFEVSHPDLDALVALARELPGVHGARMTGAGFGGFVLMVVDAAAVQRVAEALVETYYKPRERAPVILDAGAGGSPARVDFPRTQIPADA